MPYIPFTDEQIVLANSVDLEHFLRMRGERLERVGISSKLIYTDGSGTNDSIMIHGNEWYDHKNQTGGGAIKFMQEFYGMSFAEAVQELLGVTVSPVSHRSISDMPKEEKKEFILPEKAPNMRRVFAYLIKQRFLRSDVLVHFAKAGKLFEDAKYHNAVFVGLDENGVPRQASKRSTTTMGKTVKLTVEGSDTKYSFAHYGTSGRLYVFEAPIDMLSYISLHPENWQEHSYIAMNGVYESAVLYALDTHSNIDHVILCTDNDEGGIDGAERIRDILNERGFTNITRLYPTNKDWNEDLKARNGQPAISAEPHKRKALYYGYVQQLRYYPCRPDRLSEQIKNAFKYGQTKYLAEYALAGSAFFMRVKGDFVQISGSGSNFYASGNHRTILNGDSLQNVDLQSTDVHFATLELQNFSEDGVYFNKAINASEFIQNGCKVSFQDSGIFGWVLEDDYTYTGAMNLVGDTLDLNGHTLDLNGHTLTVNGDLTQSGGNIKINGGELIVNGNYKIQTTGNDASSGTLEMKNADDKVAVTGDFVTRSTANHSSLLTAGTMTIGGNFNQYNSNNNYYNFTTSGTHKVILNGSKKQTVNFANSGNSYFNEIEIANTSEDGVNFSTTTYVIKSLYDTDSAVTGSARLYLGSSAQLADNKWSYDLCIDHNRTLSDDWKIGGSLYITGNTFDINGKKLMVGKDIGINNGTLYVNGGTVETGRIYGYLNYVRPERIELIADEMIAIKSDIDRWREKKESQKANAAYNSVLNDGLEDDDE